MQKHIQRIIGVEFGKVIRNSGWLVLANVGSKVISLAQAIVVARVLGVESFGALTLVIAYVTIVNQFVDVRVWETVTKYLSDFLVKGDSERAVAVIKLSFLIDLLTGVLAFLIVIWGQPLASRLLPSLAVEERLIVLYGLSLLFGTVNNTGQAVLRVFDQFRWLAGWSVVTSLVRNVGVIGALWAGFGLEGVLFAYMISALVESLGILLSSRRAVNCFIGKHKAKISLLREIYGEIALFIFHTNLTTFWKAINKNLDVIILGHYWGFTQVGYFQQAKHIVSQQGVITNPYYQSLYPELVKMWASGDVSAYKRLVKKITLVGGIMAGFSGLMLSLLAPWIVRLTIGEEYLPAVGAIRIMVWGMMIAVAFIWARPTVIAIGKPQIGNWAAGLSALLFIIVSFVIVPSWGHLGSAVTFLLPRVVAPAIIVREYHLHLKGLSSHTGQLGSPALDTNR